MYGPASFHCASRRDRPCAMSVATRQSLCRATRNITRGKVRSQISVTSPRKLAEQALQSLIPSLRRFSCPHGADEIRQHAVTRGFNARIVLHDRKPEHIKIKSQRGAGAFEVGQRIRSQQQFWLDAAVHAVAALRFDLDV